MTRQESDREDLLREATALVERIELAPPGSTEAEHVVAGFRRAGALSIYFGADPVYHFNPAGELRRAYLGGLLYKAEGNRLVSLERVRTTSEVQLLSRTLSDDALPKVLATMHNRLSGLEQQIANGTMSIVGQVPEDTDVLGRVAAWLREHGNIQVAAEPFAE